MNRAMELSKITKKHLNGIKKAPSKKMTEAAKKIEEIQILIGNGYEA